MGTFVGKITDQPQGKVLHSGNLIELWFSKGNDSAVLSGDTDEFGKLALKLLELVTAATSQKHTTAGFPATPVFRVQVQDVREAGYGKEVLLTLRNEQRVLFPFSIAAHEVPALISDLTKAAEKAS
jgi:hypothetical protein